MSLIIPVCALATPSFAADKPGERKGSSFSIRWENDTFGGTDANYTNGFSLALTQQGRGPIGGAWHLFGDPEGEKFTTYDLGQLVFNPDDTGRRVPDPSDRPYAGFLYLGLTTFLQHDESLHGLKLFVGVVGPVSLSEAVQKATHRVFLYNMPQGWDFQLKNEPVVNLLYEYRHKITFTPRDAAVGVELIPVGSAMLGNFLIQAQAEAQFRIGYHLPDDFGATVLRGIGNLPFPQVGGTRHSWGFYAFAGGSASLVARNLTLDGNTFANSRSVDKRLFLPALEFGASLCTSRFQASFSYVMMGQEFYGQHVREDYGSILLSYFFK